MRGCATVNEGTSRKQHLLRLDLFGLFGRYGGGFGLGRWLCVDVLAVGFSCLRLLALGAARFARLRSFARSWRRRRDGLDLANFNAVLLRDTGQRSASTRGLLHQLEALQQSRRAQSPSY